MEGWVHKKALTATKNKWERRYLTLRGTKVAYFGSEKEAAKEKAAKKVLVLTAKSSIAQPAYFHPNEFELTVASGSKGVLYAYTDTKADSDAWVAAISAVIADLKATAPGLCPVFTCSACRCPDSVALL